MKKWMLFLLVGFVLAVPLSLVTVCGRSGGEGSQPSGDAALADNGPKTKSPSRSKKVITAWARLYNGPGNEYDYARGIAVDSQGNVYVTGSSRGFATNTADPLAYATLKYSPNGQLLWARRYKEAGDHWSSAPTMALDGLGNVFVAGSSQGSGTSYDYATLKYSPNGQLVWEQRYDGPENMTDEVCAIAVDGEGSICVTGTSWGSVTGSDYATLKYSPNGHLLWSRSYNGPANLGDSPCAIAVDSQGNVYVTGSSRGSQGIREYATLKYSPSGKLLWEERYNGPTNRGGLATALALDGSGNVYVTGASWESDNTSADYATLKYSPNGHLLWSRSYNGPANLDDCPRAIALDSQGNVYVTGETAGPTGSTDCLTIRYTQNFQEGQ